VTLRTKTAALLAAIVGAALATAGVVWLRSQEHALERTVVEGLDGQARIAAHGIGSFVDEGLSDARAVALAFPAEALAAGRLPEIEAHLDRMRSMFPGFQDGIWVLDAQGRFVTDAPRHAELSGESFAPAEYFQRTVRERRGIVGEPERSRRTGRSVVTFTAPVRDSAGAIVAVVACAAGLPNRFLLQDRLLSTQSYCARTANVSGRERARRNAAQAGRPGGAKLARRVRGG